MSLERTPVRGGVTRKAWCGVAMCLGYHFIGRVGRRIVCLKGLGIDVQISRWLYRIPDLHFPLQQIATARHNAVVVIPAIPAAPCCDHNPRPIIVDSGSWEAASPAIRTLCPFRVRIGLKKLKACPR